MTRTVPATEAKNRLGAYLKLVATEGEDIVIVNHGKPQAVLVPYEEYRDMVNERERARRLKAFERLEALASKVQKRNADLADDEAVSLAQEIRDAAIQAILDRRELRYTVDPGQ